MSRNNTITLNKITDEAKASLKVRVISAIVGLAIIIPAIILGDWLFFVEIFAFVAIASFEIVHCAKKKYSKWLYGSTFVAMEAICFWPVFRNLVVNQGLFGDGHIYPYFDSLYISVILLVVSIFALFYIIMWDENFTVRDACSIFTIGILVALGFQGLAFVRF